MVRSHPYFSESVNCWEGDPWQHFCLGSTFPWQCFCLGSCFSCFNRHTLSTSRVSRQAETLACCVLFTHMYCKFQNMCAEKELTQQLAISDNPTLMNTVIQASSVTFCTHLAIRGRPLIIWGAWWKLQKKEKNDLEGFQKKMIWQKSSPCLPPDD